MEQQTKTLVGVDDSPFDADAVDDASALRRRADGVLAGQKEALELAVAGQPLASILDVLVRTAEQQSSARGVAQASILLVDADSGLLRLGAGGSLPDGFLQALEGLPLGPSAGPYGAAAHALAPVFSPDVSAPSSDWPAFRALAVAHGLRACWSAPILSSERVVLGVFAVFRHEPRPPPASDLVQLQSILHSAVLVLEQDRRERGRHLAERHTENFLATLAHELRNPLAPLRNAIELLGRVGVDPDMMERARSIMSRQVTQLAHLIDELSDLPRSHAPVAHGDFQAAVGAADLQAPHPMTESPDPSTDQRPNEMAPAATTRPEEADPTLAGEVSGVRRVLVADDNDMVRESFVELLESEGYEVRTAVDGLQAVEVAEQWRPHVVLLDIHMPRLSGLESARRLRAAHSPQAMTLLMMSGMTLNDAWIRHAKAAGFDDCLDKTADPQLWLARLRQVLH